MAEGFKIGEGFIEIEPDVDLAAFRTAAKAAGLAVGDEIAIGVDKRRNLIAERALAGLINPSPAVLSALRTGVPRVLSSPLGLAGITLGVAFASSFVGAAVGVLASAGTAAAFGVIGTLALRENERVKAAFTETSGVLRTVFRDAAAPMVAPLVVSLGIVRETVRNLGPELRSIFESVAGVIPPITRDVSTFVEVLAQAAERNLPAFNNVLERVSGNLPGLAQHLAGFFDIIGENEDSLKQAVDLFFDFANALIDEAGPAVTELTDLWNQMGPTIDLLIAGVDLLIQGLNLFSGVLAIINPLISAFADDLQEAADIVELAAGPIIWLAEQLGLYSSAANEASDANVTYATTLVGAITQTEQFVSAAMRGTPAGEQMADAIHTLNDSAASATDQIKAFNQVLDALIGKNISLQEAKIKTQQAIDDLSKAIEGESEKVKDNSHSLNINTQRGRDNYTQVIKVAEGIVDQIQAYADLHGQGPALQRFTDRSISNFRSTLREAGFTKGQIDKLTESIGLIPSAKKTIVTLADNASSKIASLKTAIASIPRNVHIIAEARTQFIGSGLLPNQRAEGGIIPDVYGGRFAGQFPRGGRVPLGLGGPKEDNLVAFVSSGEYWVNAASTAKHLKLLEAINNDKVNYTEVSGGTSRSSIPAAQYMPQPAMFNLYDVNNVLIGTMEGIAEEAEHRTAWENSVGRR